MMLKLEAVKEFKTSYWPYSPHDDKCAFSEAWGIFLDGLCKDNQISSHQYNTWATPKFKKGLTGA